MAQVVPVKILDPGLAKIFDPIGMLDAHSSWAAPAFRPETHRDYEAFEAGYARLQRHEVYSFRCGALFPIFDFLTVISLSFISTSAHFSRAVLIFSDPCAVQDDGFTEVLKHLSATVDTFQHSSKHDRRKSASLERRESMGWFSTP
jgi:hypothetical protein